MKPARIVHLVAHRGNAREYPENTLPALQSALDLGARFLEIDTHLSSDGVPVVIHDADLARTTGATGNVFDKPVAELVNIEAAERQRFGTQYAGTCIPTLADAARLLDERPEVTLFVEVKRASLAHFGHDQVVPQILEAVRPWRSQVVIISFDLPAVFRARQIGGFRIGWVLPQYDSHTRLKCEALQPEFLFCDEEKIGAVEPLWRGTWRWVIYEVTTIEQALSLAARGADFVETMAVRDLGIAMRARTSAIA
ncbi:MAG: glycerophosphodiester phosphodiesterase family protein [Steroidobacteraceae bacterium]|jgi:glycerophosphoryl diester phosphodiesterase